MDETLSRLRAALSDRYDVERQIGQGGMATVYGATDRKHHRQVAIKVLRREVAATLGAERFLREIEVSAGLQHPHVVPLYDSGDAGGVLYYVMPFVAGESLRDRLTRESRIPFQEAVTLTREVASALAYAHQQGVIHRDIKPENILLSGGHAMVADFGIARALKAAATEGTQMTGLGLAIGTPAYMSPEQATASEIDARSDQYSLACVFYEMVTGQAPFGGPTMQSVLTQSLTGPRPRLSRVTKATPPEADAPVVRALSADPAARYPSVVDFGAALERAAGGGSGAVAERRMLRRLVVGLPLGVALVAALVFVLVPRGGVVVKGAESIAVLPFNASGPGVELLGEGMVDLLSTNLNSVGGIRAVEPRTVLARWKKDGEPGDIEGALALARGVKAGSVVLGSIVATGSRVRISADLYGGDGKSLSRAQVDGSADSVLQLVDQLSLDLVRDIWQSKEPVPSLRVSGLTTGSLAAMREYLTGEQYYRRSAWDSAQAAFGRAVEQDSTFALAHYRLAMALGWKGGYGTPRAGAASAAAERFANRLPQRERTLVGAYRLFSQGKLAAADSMRRYVGQHPEDADGWYLLGESQYHTRNLTGLDAAALREPFDRVLALDSTLTPAAIHPLEITLADRDSTNFRRYLTVMKDWADPDEASAYEAAGDMVWRGTLPDSAGGRRLGAHMGVTMATYVAAIKQPTANSDTALAAYRRMVDAVSRSTVDSNQRVQMRAGANLVAIGQGRFKLAEQLNDSLDNISPEQAGGMRLIPHVLGFAPPEYEAEFQSSFVKAPVTSPFQAVFLALILLNTGEGPRAGRLIDSLARDTTKMPGFLRGAVIGARGIRKVQLGDTIGAIADLRYGSERVGNSMVFNGGARLQLGAVLATRPATREEGLRLLRHGFDSDLGLQAIAAYSLGRAAEAAGQRDLAIEGYSTFLRMWDHADPSVQGRVTEAKDALARLTAEGK